MTYEKYMGKALELALKGKTSPNPRVGCVIVKNDKIIGTGYHKKAGLAHAEINALSSCNPKNATMFVNLEPCCHHGKTGPCTKAIIKAGIKHVVVGIEDPNMLVASKGIEELRKAGIKVTVGVLAKDAHYINRVFIKYITTNQPYIIMKAALSINGKIAGQEQRWITSSKSREYVHTIRDNVDAILVGIGTVLKDNPKLTCRKDNGKDPIRVIIDSKLRISLTSNVFNDDNVIIATTTGHDKKKKKALEKKGISVLVVNKDKKVNIKKLLKLLATQEITSVLVEGGSRIFSSFANITDEYLFFISPMLIKDKGSKPLFSSLLNEITLNNSSYQTFDNDLLVRCYR